MAYMQHGEGKVRLLTVPGTKHCGITTGAVDVEYQIDLLFNNEALNNDEFLLDNLSFNGYWAAMSTVPIYISCEQLSVRVCDDFMQMGGTRCIGARVKISPLPGVWVGCSKGMHDNAFI